MQFKHPEILYALFLLLIPIFIHLFQLRRFQKMDFTNVAFLRKVTVQTRKSSKIKKWLTLFMRLLAFASIIIAFAQPFSISKNAIEKEVETTIYIDNSFSMQAKGPRGTLLERALQDLFEKTNDEERLNWFTNNSERKNTSVQDFKNEVLQIDYSSNQLTPSQVLLKSNQLFSNRKDTQKQLIFISDFQHKEDFPIIPDDIQIKAVPLKSVKTSNITLDSVFVISRNASTIKLKVKVTKQGEVPNEAPVSLFNKGNLIAKTAVEFSDQSEGEIFFDIDATEDFIGKLEVLESNLPFDNELYFSINKPEKIKVLTVNETDGSFLQRLFTDERFHLIQQAHNTLDYNIIPEQNFIVLNQLKEIPSSLSTSLKSFSDNGGSVLIIPSVQADLKSYNSFLLNLNIGSFTETKPQENRITNIVFSHLLFQDVFEREVVNFQYPKVNSFYNISSLGTPALSFEDGKPFLIQKDKIYLFTAAIDQENSNFLNSPLIVPTVYNMGLQSLPLSKMYYTIGKQNTFAVPLQLGPDEILSIRDSTESFIPLQQTKANHVLITTTDSPSKSGSYTVVQRDNVLQNISYNYSREESRMQFLDPNNWNGAEIHSSVQELFSSISEANSINGFWKLFAIFALIFLIFEMLILKFWE
ncbi:MAG TPA: BatA domain-containing protein [Aequorivita sp.]|nr:BatA domain-containing protein [Aequorivita sp.]